MTTAAPTLSPSQQSDCQEARGWPLERILFLMAGTMTAISVIFVAVVSPWFLLLTGFVVVN